MGFPFPAPSTFLLLLYIFPLLLVAANSIPEIPSPFHEATKPLRIPRDPESDTPNEARVGVVVPLCNVTQCNASESDDDGQDLLQKRQAHSWPGRFIERFRSLTPWRDFPPSLTPWRDFSLPPQGMPPTPKTCTHQSDRLKPTQNSSAWY